MNERRSFLKKLGLGLFAAPAVAKAVVAASQKEEPVFVNTRPIDPRNLILPWAQTGGAGMTMCFGYAMESAETGQPVKVRVFHS